MEFIYLSPVTIGALLGVAGTRTARGVPDLWGGGVVELNMGINPTAALRELAPVWNWLKTRPVMREVGKVSDDIQMKVAPMAMGTDQARALAVDFANADRKARYQWPRFDEILKKNFKPAELVDMFNAAEEENQLRMAGRTDPTKGINRLPADQRSVVELMHNYGAQLLKRAQAVGMIETQGVPYWAPHIAVLVGEDGEFKLPPMGERVSALDPKGGNLVASAPSAMHREYKTIEEAEAAVKAKFGESATIARNLRVMPLAMSRLERALAGRELIESIRQVGVKAGLELVKDGPEAEYFTLNHPAFKTYGPAMSDGKVRKDDEGNPIMVSRQLHVATEFEGPLRAVLSEKAGKAYGALMALKGKSMGLIMYSPLIHNGVEFGRAFPLMPGKVLSFRVYFDGYHAKQDAAFMREAIDNRLVPIGHRGALQDITGITEEPDINPGRSLTAEALGRVTDLVSKDAGQAVRHGIDAAGNFWHNTLLWDRVGDLQMGIYKNVLEAEQARLIQEGFETNAARKAAGVEAAHLANRFAGSLPNESMSVNARKAANLMLFSRSFTIGNLGVMKDIATGLPRDVRAQLVRDVGQKITDNVRTAAQKKAIKAFVVDIALMYAGNSVMQDTFDMLLRDKSLEDVQHGYVDRMNRLMQKGRESPLDLLNSPLASLESLSSTSGNEPGKENRVHFGEDEHGTAIYMRLPTGKIGEDFEGWMTSPLQTLQRKESQFTRPAMQTLTNDKGFGRQVYDSDNPGFVGAAKSIAALSWNFLQSQVPVESVKSVAELASGHGDKTDWLKALGPLAGVTFSKGAPGGPEMGEVYDEERRQHNAVLAAMPKAKQLIKDRNTSAAIGVMRGAGMTPYEIRSALGRATNPHLSPGQMKRFARTATDEDKQRMAGLSNQ